VGIGSDSCRKFDLGKINLRNENVWNINVRHIFLSFQFLFYFIDELLLKT
jgi:hypothetical protein